MLANLAWTSGEKDIKKTQIMNRSTIFSIGMLIAFFLPWYDVSIFTFSGYNIPTSLDKLSYLYTTLHSDTNTELYKFSYILYIIPVCCLINICEYFFHNKTSDFLAGRFQFVIGIFVLFVMPFSFITPEDKKTILTPLVTPKVDIGYYLTIIFGFWGLFFSEYKKNNLSQKEEVINDNSNLLNQLAQLQSLKEKNVISEELFEKQKQDILDQLQSIKRQEEFQKGIRVDIIPKKKKSNIDLKKWSKENKRIIYSVAIIIVIGACSIIWHLNRNITVVPYLKKDGKYIIVDSANMNIISDVEYDGISSFSEGLTKIEKDNRYGFIDKKGKLTVPIEYDDVEDFKGGMAAVKKDNKWGFINNNGNLVIPINYNYTRTFNNGVAWVSNNSNGWDLIDTTGKTIITNKQEPTDFDKKLSLSFEEGSNKKWSLFTKSGQVVFDKRYDYAQFADEDLIRVYNSIDNDSQHRTKEGLININGDIIVTPKYNDIDNFYEGLSVVTNNSKCGVIDKTGKIIVDLIYDEILGFRNGVSFVESENKWGVIDNKGNIIIPLKYYGQSYGSRISETTGYSFFNGVGFGFVKENGKWGLIDKSGNYKIYPKYDGYRYLGEGITAVLLNDRWGFVNEHGDEYIYPKYQIDLSNNPECRNGLIIVSKEGSDSRFFIDRAGREFKEE